MAENEGLEVELPLDGAGTLLTRGREAAGKSRADIAALTKISERQIAALEAGDYAALPSRIYAIGFARSYAKAVGLDPVAMGSMVRSELAEREPEPRRTVPSFEPGDPARLPGRRIAWFAAAGVAAVLAAVLVLWPGLYAPAGTLPSTLIGADPAVVAAAPVAVAAPAAGPVVFTATRDQVWVRFADASGGQLMQKVLAMGESWTVPDGTPGVTLSTARPDGLAITVGGRAVPPLAETEQMLSDVPVTAAALLARGSGGTQAAPPVAAVSQPHRQPRDAAMARPRQSAAADASGAEPVVIAAPAAAAAPVPAEGTDTAAADS